MQFSSGKSDVERYEVSQVETVVVPWMGTRTALNADCSACQVRGPSREEVLYSESHLDFSSDGMAHTLGVNSIAEEWQHVSRSLYPVGTAERLTVDLVTWMATSRVRAAI